MLSGLGSRASSTTLGGNTLCGASSSDSQEGLLLDRPNSTLTSYITPPGSISGPLAPESIIGGGEEPVSILYHDPSKPEFPSRPKKCSSDFAVGLHPPHYHCFTRSGSTHASKHESTVKVFVAELKSEVSKKVIPPDTSELETICTNIVKQHNAKSLQKTDIRITDLNDNMKLRLEVSCHYGTLIQLSRRFKPGAWGRLSEEYK
jgi:hypothetical protein